MQPTQWFKNSILTMTLRIRIMPILRLSFLIILFTPCIAVKSFSILNNLSTFNSLYNLGNLKSLNNLFTRFAEPPLSVIAFIISSKGRLQKLSIKYAQI